MARQEIQAATTHVIRVEGFHDSRDPTNLETPDAPTVFLDAATIKEAVITDVSDPANPVVLGSPLTLIADGSGGGYGVDLVHDFESGALVPGVRITIVSTLEESGVHWETPTEEQVWVIT